MRRRAWPRCGVCGPSAARTRAASGGRGVGVSEEETGQQSARGAAAAGQPPLWPIGSVHAEWRAMRRESRGPQPRCPLVRGNGAARRPCAPRERAQGERPRSGRGRGARAAGLGGKGCADECPGLTCRRGRGQAARALGRRAARRNSRAAASTRAGRRRAWREKERCRRPEVAKAGRSCTGVSRRCAEPALRGAGAARSRRSRGVKRVRRKGAHGASKCAAAGRAAAQRAVAAAAAAMDAADADAEK
jgi:hypothetical protein